MHGLTPQQEMFCQYVVDAYGTDTRGILVSAYRKAYNCDTNNVEDKITVGQQGGGGSKCGAGCDDIIIDYHPPTISAAIYIQYHNGTNKE